MQTETLTQQGKLIVSFIHKLMAIRKPSLRQQRQAVAQKLWLVTVAAARQGYFYNQLAVSDTIDGRFNLLCLHLFIVLRRLRQESLSNRDAKAVGQALFDLAFKDMDQNLRERGISDLKVGARVKEMAKALYGRIAAFDDGLAKHRGGDHQALVLAIGKNIYSDQKSPDLELAAKLADYLVKASKNAEGLTLTQIIHQGHFEFPEVMS
ncbi:MAG: ubiquinol-cytochrome C chaperone family protein [Candidatus Pacebacteria bacterium]|nr:ubiquinol-cytochrome C chaperone family protein [Candidatus Paceibacterota bacterium]